MLVLMRKINECIKIDGGITVKVLDVVGRQVKLGIAAPSSLNIVRTELLLKNGEDADIS